MADRSKNVTSQGGDLKPLMPALVLGLGGSGMQVVARAKARVRRETAAGRTTDAVRFWAIDSVPPDRQIPALPEDGILDVNRGEFSSLVANQFNPSKWLRTGRQAVRRWVEDRYDVPVHDVIHGMKGNRALGRLAVYTNFAVIQNGINTAIAQAVQQREEYLASGDLRTEAATNLPIYLISSSCGGTGCSAFLDTVNLLWSACEANGYGAEIRAFIFAPGVFEAAVRKGLRPQAQIAAHKANAYAFFRELDHFIERSSELPEFSVRDDIRPAIEDGSLLKQVFVIDRNLRGLGFLNDQEDLYDICAESIFHFLSTPIGRPLVGESGTNVDSLSSRDQHGKRRIYCGLGIGRAVYAKETITRHLTHRFLDWFIDNGLMATPADLERVLDTDASLNALRDAIAAAKVGEEAASGLEAVRLLKRTLEGGIRDLKARKPEDRSLLATSLMTGRERESGVEYLLASAMEGIKVRATDLAALQLESFETRILDFIHSSPHGLKYATSALGRLIAWTSECRNRAAKDATSRRAASQQAHIEAVAGVERLTQVGNRAKWQPQKGASDKAAGAFQTQTQAWVNASLNAQQSDSTEDFLTSLQERLTRWQEQLTQAQVQLVLLGNEAGRVWEADDLVGADRGPSEVTLFIPPDIRPEVEDSVFNREVFATLTGHPDLALGTFMPKVLDEWRATGVAPLGFIDLADTGGAGAKAIESFRNFILERGEAEIARLRLLPETIVEAAALSNKTKDFGKLLAQLPTLFRHPAWAWDAPSMAVDDPPEPTWSVLRAASISKDVDKHFGLEDKDEIAARAKDASDPTRIVGLSVEWGASAHSLVGIHEWRREYLAALRNRGSDGRFAGYPPHGHYRWNDDPDSLGDVVPDYWGSGKPIEDVALGRFLDWVIQDLAANDSSTLSTVFSTKSSRELAALRGPIFADVTGRTTEFVGQTFVPENGSLAPGRRISLGGRLQELTQQVEKNVVVRQSVEQVLEALQRAIDIERLLQLAATYRDEHLIPLGEKAKGAAAEALADETDAFERWRTSREEAAALVGGAPARRKSRGAATSRARKTEATSKGKSSATSGSPARKPRSVRKG